MIYYKIEVTLASGEKKSYQFANIIHYNDVFAALKARFTLQMEATQDISGFSYTKWLDGTGQGIIVKTVCRSDSKAVK